MNRLETKSGTTTGGARFPLMLLALTLSVAPARANQYLFSFTTSQVMAALQASQGTAAYNESAYFAIFAQPDPAVVSGYTYTNINSPNRTDPNVWTASTITDPSSPNLGYSSGSPCVSNCTWADFYKGPTQTNVTVISGANGGPGGANIFIGTTWRSFSSPPYGWGGTTGVIETVMPGSSIFSFIIDTAQVLTPGSYAIKGYASDLQSGDPSTRTSDTKEDHGLAFTLNAEVVRAPEPSTFVLIAAGFAVLLWFARRHRVRQPL